MKQPRHPDPVIPHGLEGVQLKDALRAAMATPPPPDDAQGPKAHAKKRARKPKPDKK